MCIVKVVNEKYERENCLKNLINYAIHSSHCKCGLYGATGMLVGSVMEMADSMKSVKKDFKKMEGRQLLHLIVSFDNGGESWVTPQIAYEIGYRFAATYLVGKQVVFGVHDNENNVHIHFVINSVCYDTGLKYGIAFGEPEVMRHRIEDMIEKYYLKRGIEILE